MSALITLRDVTVGYEDKAIVSGIDADFLRGKMTCILGPNGSGKTTLLRTLAALLAPLAGQVSLAGRELSRIKVANLAQIMSVVLTQHLELDNMTGRDVVALGRYPYTGFFGRLSQTDAAIVQECLAVSMAEHLAERFFDQMSDGEKQKVLIARALAQEPQVLILDEPTMHLDLRHKIEMLMLLQRLALEQEITVLLTLHEPDLALKACDQLVLVKDGQVLAQGPSASVVRAEAFAILYGISGAGFDPLTCGIEFPAAQTRHVFIVGGGGSATPCYRACARMGIGFGSGVLHRGDLDYYTAVNMAAPLVSVPAFSQISAGALADAWNLAQQYRAVIDCGFPRGESNKLNWQLLELARQQGLDLFSMREELPLGAKRLTSLEELPYLLRTSKEE